MTEEEKEAINRLEDYEDLSLFPVNMREDFRIISRLIQNQEYMIQEQQEEIKKKDKQIELMAKAILEDTKELDTFWCNGCFKTVECPYKNPKECIKQYFKKQVEEV